MERWRHLKNIICMKEKNLSITHIASDSLNIQIVHYLTLKIIYKINIVEI